MFYGLSFLFLFSILRQGIHDLRVWPGKVADGDAGTPGKFSKESANEMSKLAKVNFVPFSWQFFNPSSILGGAYRPPLAENF